MSDSPDPSLLPQHPSDQALEHNSLRHRASLLIRKELRETLRDRRTIITLLAMPLLLYPLMGMVFRFLAVSQLKKEAGLVYNLVVGTQEEAQWLQSTLDLGNRMMARREQRDAQAARESAKSRNATPDAVIPETNVAPDPASASDNHTAASENGSPPEEPGRPHFELKVTDKPGLSSLEQEVASLNADLGIRIVADPTGAADGPLNLRSDVRLVSCRDSATSREALRYVEDRIQAANLLYLLSIGRTVDPNLRTPARLTHEAVPSSQKSRGFLGLLPLVLLLMTVTGGVYPAIDLTAGERERDTLETLIALPIPRVHLLIAKYVAVFTVTMLTGLMNILAMSATVYTLRMEKQLFGDTGLTVGLGLALIGTQVVFGLFYSAVLLALTSSSRSFKEAQAYLIPLMLMSIAPGLVILLPGWHLEGAIAVVPLVNMLLLARDVFEGTVQILPAAAAVLSTLIYAAGALMAAAHVFGTDAASIGSRGTWTELLRRPTHQRPHAPLTSAMMTLTLLFPLYFFCNGVLSRASESDPQTHLLTGAVLTILLFGGFPLLVAVWGRLRLVSTWQFTLPRVPVWPGALILGLSLWPWIYELVLATQQFGITRIDADRLRLVSELLQKLQAVPTALLLITLGVVPGIFEELYFRGFLLRSLRNAFRPLTAILLCGIVFGVFHVIAAEGASPERLLPSATLGCLLSWVAVRSNSVLPGMLLHVCHNSALLLIARYQDQFAAATLGGIYEEHLPGPWLIGSAAAIVFGLVWTTYATRSFRPQPASATS